MKKSITRLLTYLVKNDILWKLLRPGARVGFMLNNERQKHQKRELDKKLVFHDFFKPLQVLNGPFAGMKYPAMDSVGSAIFPKLLGSYESELRPVLEDLFSNDYSEIIDVGCAEGYYAVGLAMHYKNSKVFAYDISEKARNLCLDMAKLNRVDNQVEIRSKLTREILGNFKFSAKGLIICDCEGFETELFDASNLDNLKECDLIIELHDFRNLNISTILKELFKTTHSLESIFSIDDVQKVLTYDYPELKNMPLQEKMNILRENRPAIMEWLICKTKL